ncbi:MAG: hypothetical protein HC906_18265 [Bacteroidales bacterium]|nr:hypothetical protein [Bacteroidales bacterium]
MTVRGTYTNYADYRVPANVIPIYSGNAFLHKNRLRNTAGKEQNFHFSLGYVGEHVNNRLFFSVVSSRSGMFANAHGLEPREADTARFDKFARDILDPFHEVNHLKLVIKPIGKVTG